MLDIKLIRENPDLVKENLEKRGDAEKLKWVDELLEHDKKWREGLKKIEQLRHERNIITEKIAQLKKEGKPVKKEIKEVADIPEKIKKLEEQNEKYREKIDWLLMRIPNILHESVPIGKDEGENKVIRTWGKIPKFNFEPKNHLEILEGLGLIESDSAAKASGAGFFYLKGNLALLDNALSRYAIDFLIKKGYVLVVPPSMLKRRSYEGVIDMEAFENMLYKIDSEDLYLIATAEHPLAAMYLGETIDANCLPTRLAGVSTNFRKEVGAHGKYTKGLFRMHQFNKVEQFIFCHPKDSWQYFDEVQKNAEELYQHLGLAYRVVNLCSGDIGRVATKTLDIEAWMADGIYREIGSNSNCTDYQARRLGIKYREGPGKPPAGFVHTINNTALATSRTMVAILEQNQQKNSSVLIPKVLWPYTGFKKLERKII